MNRHISHDLRDLRAAAVQTHAGLAQAFGLATFTIHALETLMQTTQDLIGKIAELGADETAYEKREQALVDALTAAKADLQAKLDAAVAAGTAPDLTPEIASLQAIIDGIPSDVPPTVPAT
jgi:hypothetical protein